MSVTIREINENDPRMISEAFQEQGWNKPEAQYESYISEQNNGERVTLVAEIDGAFVGYVNVIWKSYYSSFKEQNIPEINDFNISKIRY